MIEKVFEFGERLKQQKITVHIAIAYFDYLLFKAYLKDTSSSCEEMPRTPP